MPIRVIPGHPPKRKNEFYKKHDFSWKSSKKRWQTAQMASWPLLPGAIEYFVKGFPKLKNGKKCDFRFFLSTCFFFPPEFHAEFSFAIENSTKNPHLGWKKNEILSKTKILTIYHSTRDINILNTQPCGLMGIFWTQTNTPNGAEFDALSRKKY